MLFDCLFAFKQQQSGSSIVEPLAFLGGGIERKRRERKKGKSSLFSCFAPKSHIIRQLQLRALSAVSVRRKYECASSTPCVCVSLC